MTLYTQYGMIQGTVDEILDFITKQNKVVQTNGTNFSEEVGICEPETNDVNKIFVDMGATSNDTNQSTDNKIEVVDSLSYIKTYHKCEYCGYEKAEVDTSMILTSNPPKYSYKCPKCGKAGYIFTTEV